MWQVKQSGDRDISIYLNGEHIKTIPYQDMFEYTGPSNFPQHDKKAQHEIEIYLNKNKLKELPAYIKDLISAQYLMFYGHVDGFNTREVNGYLYLFSNTSFTGCRLKDNAANRVLLCRLMNTAVPFTDTAGLKVLITVMLLQR